MNKNDAAKYLDIGLRTLERHTSAGRITASKVKTPNGPALDYDEAELERFKREVLAPPPPSPAGSATLATTGEGVSTALVQLEPRVLAHSGTEAIDMVTVPVDVLAKLADVAATVAGRDQKPQAPLAEKLTLSLGEAAALSGIPRATLRVAVASGELAGRKMGRSVRVRREVLEAWVRETC